MVNNAQVYLCKNLKFVKKISTENRTYSTEGYKKVEFVHYRSGKKKINN